MSEDGRYVSELPSGIVKNPMLHVAGDDFNINDVVWMYADTVYPVYYDTQKIYGVIAANSTMGEKVLVAAIEQGECHE